MFKIKIDRNPLGCDNVTRILSGSLDQKIMYKTYVLNTKEVARTTEQFNPNCARHYIFNNVAIFFF